MPSKRSRSPATFALLLYEPAALMYAVRHIAGRGVHRVCLAARGGVVHRPLRTQVRRGLCRRGGFLRGGRAWGSAVPSSAGSLWGSVCPLPPGSAGCGNPGRFQGFCGLRGRGGGGFSPAAKARSRLPSARASARASPVIRLNIRLTSFVLIVGRSVQKRPGRAFFRAAGPGVHKNRCLFWQSCAGKRSPLHAAHGQPLDDVLLHQQEEDHQRHHAQHHHGEHVRPVGGKRPTLLFTASKMVWLFLDCRNIRGVKKSFQIAIEFITASVAITGRSSGTVTRKTRPHAAPVNVGGLLDLHRHAGRDKVFHEQDRHGQVHRNVDQHHAQDVVHQPQAAHQLVLGHNAHLKGHHHARQQHKNITVLNRLLRRAST